MGSEMCIRDRATYAVTAAWQLITERSDTTVAGLSTVVDVPFDPPPLATPSIAALANSPERKTGNWRQFRPVLHQELCTRCWVCFVRCPEAAISLDVHEYPVVDYDECKGCLLCVQRQSETCDSPKARLPFSEACVEKQGCELLAVSVHFYIAVLH